MSDDSQLSEVELRQQFLQAGKSFFAWNSGKNTPNILIQLEQRIGSLEASTRETTKTIAALDASLRAASDSSTRLAAALNKLTMAYIIVTGIGVVVAAVALVWQMVR